MLCMGVAIMLPADCCFVVASFFLNPPVSQEVCSDYGVAIFRHEEVPGKSPTKSEVRRKISVGEGFDRNTVCGMQLERRRR